MNEKKHPFIKGIAIALMLILIGCTFAARPLQNSMTAKVNVMTAKKRRMEFRETVIGEEWYTEDMREISIPYSLDAGLKVEAVYVSRLDRVTEGDALVRFTAASGLRALDRAETALLRARIAYRAYVEENGTPETDEYRILEKEYAQAEGAYNALMELRAKQWTLSADREGSIAEMNVYSGSVYTGMEPLCAVCGPGKELSVCVPVTEKWQRLMEEYGVSVSVRYEDTEYPAEWTVTERRGSSLYARLRVEGAPADMIGSRSVELYAMSDGNTYIVPLKALQGDSVFILEETEGYFGKEYVARQVTVETGKDNGSEVQILSGLKQGDKVITDVLGGRALYDGEKVLRDIG